MTLSPWLVTVIEVCIASCCSAMSICLVSFCLGVVFVALKERK